MSHSTRFGMDRAIRTHRTCGTGRSRQVAPQPRITTFPWLANSNTSSAVNMATRSLSVVARSMSPALPSRRRLIRLRGTCILPATFSTTSLRNTARFIVLANSKATSLPREPISWVIAITVILFFPESIDGSLCSKLIFFGGVNDGQSLGNQWPHQEDQGQCRNTSHQIVRVHDGHVALREQHGLAERVLGLVAEHQSKDQWRQWVIKFLEQVANNAKQQHEPDIKHGIVYGIGTDGANHNLSLIHISEPTRRTPISYAVF